MWLQNLRVPLAFTPTDLCEMTWYYARKIPGSTYVLENYFQIIKASQYDIHYHLHPYNTESQQKSQPDFKIHFALKLSPSIFFILIDFELFSF